MLSWLEHHQGEPEPLPEDCEEGSWSTWDVDFAHRLEWSELAELYIGAHFLDIDWLKYVILLC
jgi:hypothetical protein